MDWCCNFEAGYSLGYPLACTCFTHCGQCRGLKEFSQRSEQVFLRRVKVHCIMIKSQCPRKTKVNKASLTDKLCKQDLYKRQLYKNHTSIAWGCWAGERPWKGSWESTGRELKGNLEGAEDGGHMKIPTGPCQELCCRVPYKGLDGSC